jgi:Fe-S-cluster containining protein
VARARVNAPVGRSPAVSLYAPVVHGGSQTTSNENRALRYSLKVHCSSPPRDRALVQIVDSALADAARRSGEWLVCRPGCTQCCIGVFPINQLDVVRLREGLANLAESAPEPADSVRQRARGAVSRLSKEFPGDPATGLLDEGDEAEQRFAEFANEEPCPALDPETGLCELYEARPMTCRVFGPPVRSEDGLGVCELCFQGATDAEIAACEMKPDPEDLESALIAELEKATGARGRTIVAFCLAS